MARIERQWIDEIVEAYEFFGGKSRFPDIYLYIKQNSTRTLTPNYQNIIRYYVETHSSDSKSYCPNNEDLFYSVNGIGHGIWGLRKFRKNSMSKAGRITSRAVLSDIKQEKEDDLHYIENTKGKMKVLSSKYYERHPVYRMNAIRAHGLKCHICGFDFRQQYGKFGKDFIEIHHIIPENIDAKKMIIDPKKDLIPVCANCHRMLHRNNEQEISVEELKSILQKKRN